MQPTFFGSLCWSQGIQSEGYLCDHLVHATSVWEWTHWRVGEVSLKIQPDLYLEFSWPVHVQVFLLGFSWPEAQTEHLLVVIVENA